MPSKTLVIDGHEGSAARVAALWLPAACGNNSSRCWSRIWRARIICEQRRLSTSPLPKISSLSLMRLAPSSMLVRIGCRAKPSISGRARAAELGSSLTRQGRYLSHTLSARPPCCVSIASTSRRVLPLTPRTSKHVALSPHPSRSISARTCASGCHDVTGCFHSPLRSPSSAAFIIFAIGIVSFVPLPPSTLAIESSPPSPSSAFPAPLDPTPNRE
mmetsp:Transcript_49870/g.157805  ORF Transcript_49870/g.157805 Transcript_49870/m.157805 type:complete len:216 (-) Transcript_49870:660-1307(-)